MRGIPTVILLVAAVALSGCFQGFQEIVSPQGQTTRVFACAVLKDDPRSMTVDVQGEAGLSFSPVDPVDHLRDLLANHTAKQRDDIQVRIDPAVDRPEDGWTEDGWREVLGRHSFLQRDRVVLTVFWVQALSGEATNVLVQPGVVAIDHSQVSRKANMLGWDLDRTATAVLVHAVGHALGVVNKGIPMQENHEGAPGHSNDPGSVMHDHWDDAGADVDAGNATYMHWPPQVFADWQAAAADEQVCP